ncbi:MAG: aminotransferase class V-fold PLP-dependent enzyme [Phycisphaerales bacterium JB059]
MTHPIPIPEPSELAHLWALDPDVVYLNHGSFGACPKSVLDAQSRWRARMEHEAVTFFVRDLFEATDQARDALGPVIGARPRDLVFVPNATTGVASVIHSLDLEPGDEILFPSIEYPACRAIVHEACRRSGALPVEIDLPWPATDEETHVEAILAGVTARTRLCLLSHVTSATAVVLPAGRIIEALKERGVETLLDAAHAPGMLDLNLDGLAPAYATGNCHKWLCAPKGCAFLWVREDRQPSVRPLVHSVYAQSLDAAPWAGPHGRTRLQTDFDYVGTDDYTPRLALPEAIRFMTRTLPGGLPEVRARNNALARRGRDVLCERIDARPTAPDAMTASMCVVTLPEPTPEARARLEGTESIFNSPLQTRLLERHAIQVPVWTSPAGTPMVRLSAQLYNAPAQYEHLADALAQELGR